MATNEASPTVRSTSVAYALGELKGSVDALKESQSALSQTLAPRFLAIEVTQGHHGDRLGALERDKAFVRGGFIVVAIAVSYILGKPFVRF